jgi:hypothetical protein
MLSETGLLLQFPLQLVLRALLFLADFLAIISKDFRSSMATNYNIYDPAAPHKD